MLKLFDVPKITSCLLLKHTVTSCVSLDVVFVISVWLSRVQGLSQCMWSTVLTVGLWQLVKSCAQAVTLTNAPQHLRAIKLFKKLQKNLNTHTNGLCRQLDGLNEWATNWQMACNVGKCEFVYFGRKKWKHIFKWSMTRKCRGAKETWNPSAWNTQCRYNTHLACRYSNTFRKTYG